MLRRTGRASSRNSARRTLRTRLLLQFAELPAGSAAPSRPATAHLALVGEPRLLLADGTAFALERKDGALLALLAIDGATQRAKAAALLWPDVDDEAARNNLRQRLHRLRKRAAREIVVGVNETLRLADDITHDLTGLPGRIAEDAGAGAGDLLGPFDYANCADLNDWIAIAREQWRNARRNALAEIASRLETQGQIAPALQYAERLVADDPLLEHAHRRLMRLHYLRGDRAAALAAFARCKEVLASHLTAQPAHETVELARLVEASGTLPVALPPARPVTVLRPPRLVGRADAWRRLESAWDAQRFVVVLGEPGIGKTRLLTDFAATRPDALVAGARPGDARVPYALLARLLRTALERHPGALEPWVRDELARLVPELGPLPAGRLEPLRLQQAAGAALEAMQAAGLGALVVDDVHFADEASLETLLALIAAQRPAPLRWLLGVRTHEVPALLDAWRRKADPATVADVLLGPLDIDAIEALLESLALPDVVPQAWAEPLARHTGGNPLFILETLNAMLAQDATRAPGSVARLPAPGNVGALIERRLAQLSAPALRLARVAALAGQDFSVELAAQVLLSHPLDLTEAWRELEAALVIRDNAFAHDLILESTLRSIPAPIARLLHRDIARYLAAHGALAASRRVEEVAHWDAAFESFQRAGLRAEAFRARSESIESLLFVADTDRGRAAVEAMRALARSDAERLDVLIAQAIVQLMAVESRAAVETAREAVALAQALGAVGRELDAASMLATGLGQSGRAVEGVAVLEPFRERVEAEDDLERRYKYWSNLAYVLQIANRRSQCVHALERAIALAEALGNLGEVQTNTANLAAALSDLGRPAEALRLAERAFRLRDRLGPLNSVPSAALESQLAQYLAALGQYGRALAHFEASAAAFRAAHHAAWIAVVENHLATTWLHLGQPGRAQQALSPLGSGVLPGTRGRRRIVESRIDAALGRPRKPGLLHQALDDLRSDPYIHLLVRLETAQDLPAPEAAALCAELEAGAERLEYLGTALKVRVLRAEHLPRAGDVASALATVRAVGSFETLAPRDVYLPEALWIVFRVLDAAGDHAGAADMLRRAVRWIREVALPAVPAPLVDAFIERNPVNRAVLATAGRHFKTGPEER